MICNLKIWFKREGEDCPNGLTMIIKVIIRRTIDSTSQTLHAGGLHRASDTDQTMSISRWQRPPILNSGSNEFLHTKMNAKLARAGASKQSDERW